MIAQRLLTRIAGMARLCRPPAFCKPLTCALLVMGVLTAHVADFSAARAQSVDTIGPQLALTHIINRQRPSGIRQTVTRPGFRFISRIGAYSGILTASEGPGRSTSLARDDIILTNAEFITFTPFGIDGPVTTNWLVQLRPLGDGQITLTVPEGTFTDAAGNPNQAFSISANHESRPPTIESVIRRNDLLHNGRRFQRLTWRITFSEPVTNVDLNDFVVRGHATAGPVSVVPVAGQMGTYDVTAEPRFTGAQKAELTLALATDNNIADTAGKPLQGGFPAGAETRYTLDGANPSVSQLDILEAGINSGERALFSRIPNGFATNVDRILWFLEFSEPVTGVDLNDFRLTGFPDTADYRLSVAPVGQPPTPIWRVVLTGAGLVNHEGRVRLSFAPPFVSLNIRDRVGLHAPRTLPEGAETDVIFDNSVVAVESIDAPQTYRGRGRIPVTVDFSEPVKGFELSDITVQNGTARNLERDATDQSRYRFDVIPDAEETLQIAIRERSVKDITGLNQSNPAPSRTVAVAYDDRPPVITRLTRQTPTSRLTNGTELTWRVVFSEAVKDVDAADFRVVGAPSNARLSIREVSGEENTYDITVDRLRDVRSTKAVEGEVRLALASRPTITDLLNLPLVATLPQDAETEYFLDNTRPEYELRGLPDLVRGTNPVPLTYVFSESVGDLRPRQFSITNGTISRIEPHPDEANAFIVTLVPDGAGDIRINLRRGIRDIAGGILVDPFSRFGRVIPYRSGPFRISHLRFGRQTHSITNVDTLRWNVRFSGEPRGEDGSAVVDIVALFEATGAPQGTTLRSSREQSGRYILTLSGDALANFDGSITLSPRLNGTGLTDQGGYPLSPGLPANAETTVQLDNTRPTARIENAPVAVWNRDRFRITVTLSEAVDYTPGPVLSMDEKNPNFDLGDVSVTNGSAVAIEQDTTDPNRYRVDIAPDGSGNIEIGIREDSFYDPAGNTIIAGQSVTVAFVDNLTVAATSPVAADGVAASLVTVRLLDAQGNALGSSGGTVVVSADGAAVSGAVTDHGDGSYSAPVTNAVAQTVTVSATLDGTALTDTAQVVFTPGPVSVAQSTVTAQPGRIVADGAATSTITVQLRDANNNDLTASGGRVRLATDLGALGAVRDNNDGTYTATLTSATTAGMATVSGTLDGAAITDTAQVVFTPGPVSVAHSTVTAQPARIVADGAATSTITVQLRDANNNPLTASGGTVRLATDLGALGAVRDNNDGTYTATLTSATTAGMATVSGTLDGVAITDTAQVVFTPGAGVTLSAQAVRVAENGGSATYTVVLDAEPTGDVTVTPTSSDPGAATVAPVLTFTAGNWDQPQRVTVTGVNDAIDNAGDARRATISHAVAGGGYDAVAVADVIATVTDDEDAGITVAPVAGLTTTEAGGRATFTVVLDSRPTGDVTLALSSSDLSEGRVAPQSLTFTAQNWGTARTVTVTGQDDAVADGDQAYEIVTAAAVSRDAAYSGRDAADIRVTNEDDDATGVTLSAQAVRVAETGGTARYTVVLDAEPTGDVTVTPSSSDPGAATVSGAVTFTAANWDQPQRVTVTGVNDAIDNAGDARRATISHAVAGGGYDAVAVADVIATVTDDEDAGITVAPVAGLTTTEAGGRATFTVVLDSRPTGDVTLALSSSDLSEGRVAPQSLTFTAQNWGTARTVTVTGQDDAVADGDQAYEIVTAAAVSTDAAYSGRDAADIRVTNEDDDATGVTLSEGAIRVAENGGSATYTVVLTSAPTGDVTVTPTSSDPGAATVAPVLTFTAGNWDQPQRVTVTGVNDAIDNAGDARRATISHAVAGGGYDAVAVADVIATVTDDEDAGITVAPVAGLTTTEAGGRATFTVVLDSRPTGDVTLALSSSDLSEGRVAPQSLTFTAQNWGTARTVTVTGQDDAVADGDQAYEIVTAAAVSTDAAYSGRDAADIRVTNEDDDATGVTLSEGAIRVAENGGSATYTVVLDAEPTGDVTVTPSSSDPGPRRFRGRSRSRPPTGTSRRGSPSPASMTLSTMRAMRAARRSAMRLRAAAMMRLRWRMSSPPSRTMRMRGSLWPPLPGSRPPRRGAGPPSPWCWTAGPPVT